MPQKFDAVRGQSVIDFAHSIQPDIIKTIYKGTTIGNKAEVKLSKITAQKIRLLLTDFSQVPGIYEIVLL